MRPAMMTVGSFLVYSAFGLVGLGISAGIFHGCVASDYGVHPAYRAYLEQKTAYDAYDAQAKRREIAIGIDQRHFEEALAGAYPVEKLPTADLQEVVMAIQAAMKERKRGPGLDYKWARGLVQELMGYKGLLKDRAWQDGRLISCEYDSEKASLECDLAREVSVLDDPHRLLLLLNGDARGVLSSLPREAKEDPPPSYPADGPKELAVPWWFGLYRWMFLSIGFMLAFVAAGYFQHLVSRADSVNAEDNRLFESVWPNPLVPTPSFALGWVIMALAAPGFALAYLVRATTLDARPVIWRLKDRLSGRTYDDEYAEVEKTLQALRERASALGGEGIVATIESQLARIHDSRNRIRLAELKTRVEDVILSLKGLDETNEICQ